MQEGLAKIPGFPACSGGFLGWVRYETSGVFDYKMVSTPEEKDWKFSNCRVTRVILTVRLAKFQEISTP